MGFKKAEKKAKKIKMAIQGASGSGKTYTGIKTAIELVAITDPGKRVAVIDTEKAADAYATKLDFDQDTDFGPPDKIDYSPKRLMEKMEEARIAGCYGAVVIDSATHFWKEPGGFLSMIDAITAAQRARGQKENSMAAWKTVDTEYRKLINYIRQYPLHVILCIRAKQGYEKQAGQSGKGTAKVGLDPEFRDNYEYELDAQFAIQEVDQDHVMVPLKHRLEEYLDRKVFKNPGRDFAEVIAKWCSDGKVQAEEAVPPPPPPAATDVAANMIETEEPPLFVQFVMELEKASTEADVKRIGSEISKAGKDKLLSGDEYKQCSELYKARLNTVRAAA